jgi:hypothetical protein
MSTDGATVSVPATQESQARTRAFARVIGPWLVIVPGIIVLRASEMGALASEFFKSVSVDWPYESNRVATDWLSHLQIADQDKGKICHLNAERILNM